ncbi:hypothetical protein SNEBB_006752 [Seison nebaliae]|nr:hypothetical protein SNEBB_006752 [Seison nebaliae]
MEKKVDDELLYDRQIRLWGATAQEHLRSSSILVVGFSNSIVEFMKNMVLSGVRRITLIWQEEKIKSERYFFSSSHRNESELKKALLESMKRLNNKVLVNVLNENGDDIDQRNGFLSKTHNILLLNEKRRSSISYWEEKFHERTNSFIALIYFLEYQEHFIMNILQKTTTFKIIPNDIQSKPIDICQLDGDSDTDCVEMSIDENEIIQMPISLKRKITTLPGESSDQMHSCKKRLKIDQIIFKSNEANFHEIFKKKKLDKFQRQTLKSLSICFLLVKYLIETNEEILRMNEHFSIKQFQTFASQTQITRKMTENVTSLHSLMTNESYPHLAAVSGGILSTEITNIIQLNNKELIENNWLVYDGEKRRAKFHKKVVKY